MTDFTKLINRGHQRYIAKYHRKRVFGECDSCTRLYLLLKYIDPNDKSITWDVCENCFSELQKEEK